MLPAEVLIDIARMALVPHDDWIDTTDITDAEAALTVLAIKFERMPLAFKVRALVEEWSQEQITRGMY